MWRGPFGVVRVNKARQWVDSTSLKEVHQCLTKLYSDLLHHFLVQVPITWTYALPVALLHLTGRWVMLMPIKWLICLGDWELFCEFTLWPSFKMCARRLDVSHMSCSLVEAQRGQLFKYVRTLTPLPLESTMQPKCILGIPVRLETTQRVELWTVTHVPWRWSSRSTCTLGTLKYSYVTHSMNNFW